MASSELRRPKSANPNRRLRTATHKVTDPRTRPEQPSLVSDQSYQQEESTYLAETCPLSVWTGLEPLDIDEAVVLSPTEPASGGIGRRNGGAKPLQRQTPSPTSTYDSLMTFECAQKASALRVLAKTLDRQRDVMQASNNGNSNPVSATAATGEPDSSSSRKTTTPPRKLRPLGREYSGPF